MIVYYNDMILEGTSEEIVYFIDIMSIKYLDKNNIPECPYKSCMPGYIEN